MKKYYSLLLALVLMLTMGGDVLAQTKAEAQKPSTAPSGMSAGHAYVDLGLSVMWATVNIGGKNPEDYGDYYAWGETDIKSSYDKANYKYFVSARNAKDADGFPINVPDSYMELGDDISGSKYDVAHTKWGGTWRLPTQMEWQELNRECVWVWTTKFDVFGYKITGPNGNWIFLPAGGFRDGGMARSVTLHGYYWSGNVDVIKNRFAHSFDITSGRRVDFSSERVSGCSVRPVFTSPKYNHNN